MRSSEIRLRKLRLRDNALLTTKSPVLPSGSNHFSRSWLFGAVAPRIYLFFYLFYCRCESLSVIHFIASYSCKILFSSQSKRIVECGTCKIRFSMPRGWLKYMLEQYILHTITTRNNFLTGRSPSSLLEHRIHLS